jgi:hypothetical protein
MKVLSAILLIALLPACGTHNKKTANLSSHTQLSEEEYYDKIAWFMSLMPCAKEVTRDGDMITITRDEDSALDKCLNMIAATPLLWKVTETSDTQIHIQVFKATSLDLLTETITKTSPCVTGVTATDKGIELTLNPSPDNEYCLNFVKSYFTIIEETETKAVLGYLTKSFVCKTDDQSVTIEHFKDFSNPNFSNVFDPFSYARATTTTTDGATNVVDLDHCDLTAKKIPGEDIPRGAYTCAATQKFVDYKHEFRFGPWSFSQMLVVDGVETPTSCKWPTLIQ